MKTMMLAAVAAGLLSVAAFAAPKSAETCEAGKGKPVCCKASVANHCGYVSCCEMGNAAFFSKKHCGTCESHKAHAQAACAAKAAPAAGAAACGAKTTLYVSCCEQGNAGFFKAAHACGAKAASCCSTAKH
jgi:hypothetical protein